MTAGWLAIVSLHIGGNSAYLLPVAAIALVIIGIWVFHAALLNHGALLGFMVIMATALCYRVRDEELPGAADQGLNWQNMVKLAVWGCLMIICFVNWRPIVRYLRDPGFMCFLLFLVLSGASTGWSEVPSMTGASVLGLFIYVMFACLLTYEFPLRTLVTTLIWALAVWCLLNWLSIMVDPSTALMDPDIESAYTRFRGISGHPNLIGAQSAIFLCLLVGGYTRDYISRKWFYVLLGIGIVTLVASQSRTSAFSLVLALTLLRYRRPFFIAALIGAMLLTIVIVTGQLANLQALFVRGGDGDVLAGRTDIWEYLDTKVRQRPLLGYGFNSFEANVAQDFNTNPNAQHVEAPAHPHNNYLEVLFSGGVITLVPYVVWSVLMLRRWFINPDFMRDSFYLFLFFASFTEVNIPAPAYLGSLVLFILLANDVRQRDRIPARDQ